MPNRHNNTSDYRYGFNGKEPDNEIKGEGNSYDYGARMYDSRIGRWGSMDPLAYNYPLASPYNFALNTPIQAMDPDGKRVYFIAGAGDDSIGWGYMKKFEEIWTELGIEGFKRIRASHHDPEELKDGAPVKDILFSLNFRRDNVIPIPRAGAVMTRDNKKIIETVKKIQDDLIQNPLKEGEQLNLSGYSYGSVLQAQVALVLVEKGQKVDNLILIGSPVAIDSPLYQKLLKAQEDGMIGQIIREDIEGDKLSNSTSDMSMLGGAFQNLGEDGPHFDFARPDNKETPDIDEGKETEKRIKELGEKLKKKGVN